MENITNKVKTISQLYKNGEDEEALGLCNEVLGVAPMLAHALHIGGVIACRRGMFDQGISFFNKTIAICSEDSNMAQVRAHLGLAHFSKGDVDEAIDNYRKAHQANPDDEVVKNLGKALNSLNLKNFPGIFINTLPKSGSVFIHSALITGLDLPKWRIGLAIFPDDIAIPEYTKRLAAGNLVSQEHLPAHNKNLITLRQSGIDRLVVHVRDPRQALLSWVHHVDRQYKNGNFEPTGYPLCDGYFSLSYKGQKDCEPYFSLDFEEKINWHIEYYLPLLIDWIKGWVAVGENPAHDLKILFTRFQDMKSDPDTLFRSILSFYDIHPSDFHQPHIELKDGRLHFRKGKVNEWKAVFTNEQIEKATHMIPKALAGKFDWDY